jgi:cell division protein FtsB
MVSNVTIQSANRKFPLKMLENALRLCPSGEMNLLTSKHETPRERLSRLGALGYLLLLGLLAFAGPYGVLSWGENISLLEKRQAQIKRLQAERAELDNLVTRLNPDNVDPDLATELVRKNLNVAHPDEYVMEVKPTE